MNAIHERMRPAAVLAASLLLLGAFSAPGAAEDDARSMLERTSKALGEDRSWTTRVEKGLHIAWDTPGWGTLKADYARAVKKPDKVKIDQDNSAYDHPFYRMYYGNGGDAWYVVNLNAGRSANVAANLKNLLDRVDGVAYYLASCDTFFTVPVVPGDSLLSGTGLLRAGCVHEGDTILWDVNERTYVPARRVERKANRVYLLEDYRAVGGRLVPFHVTVYAEGRKAEEFVWSTVAFDEAIEDAVFEENRPPAQ